MDVILLERIEKLGSIGDVVTVKNGFARNFLLPNGKALRANEFEPQGLRGQSREDRGDERRTPQRGREGRGQGRRRQDPADPPGLERRPALRLGQRARPRRGAGGPGPQDRQAPDRARQADQGDRRPGREDRASPGSFGHDQRQRRPLARRGRAAGAGQGRDGRDVREGRGRLHRGARRVARAGRDRLRRACSRGGACRGGCAPRRARGRASCGSRGADEADKA